VNFFDEKNIKYLDMDENEIINAGKEFLGLINQERFQWDNYSSIQKEFKGLLNPLHLDMYYAKAIPCDCYLNKSVQN
jgi:hypothetical protein